MKRKLSILVALTFASSLSAFVFLATPGKTVGSSDLAQISGKNITFYAAKKTNAQTPTITQNLPASTTTPKGTPVTLTIGASVSDGGTLSYKWYQSIKKDASGAKEVAGATASSYSVPVNATGTFYYYCIVTNTNTSATGKTTASIKSSIAAVVVFINDQATLTSTIGTVDNDASTITGIPYGTTLAAFEAAITPAAGATFDVYQSDGTTPATNLATGYKVIVTAQDGVTQKTYTISVNIGDVTSPGFHTGVLSSDATITLAGGTFKAGTITAADFSFGGPNAVPLAAGTFTRISDTVVHISNLSGLANSDINTVTVLAATQATQATSVAGRVMEDAYSNAFASSDQDDTVTITLNGSGTYMPSVTSADFMFFGINASKLAAGTFTRTSDKVVTITGLNLSAYAYNQAVVKDSAQATYTFTITPVALSTLPAAPTTGALAQGTNGGTSKLTGVDSTMEYKLNNGAYSAISGTEVDNISVNAGDIIYVRYAAADPLPASKTQNLTVALTDIKPAAAPTTAALDPGTNGRTTKLTGVDSTMEYKVNTGAYSAISGTEVDNISVNAGDTIYVRYAATALQPASETQNLTVTAADIKIADVTSPGFLLGSLSTDATITLAGGTFKAGTITAADFSFGGPNAVQLAAGTFTRISDTVVHISDLSGLTYSEINTVTVFGATQATQATSVAGRVMEDSYSNAFASSEGDDTVTITLNGSGTYMPSITSADFNFLGTNASKLAAGTFTRTSDQVVTITGLNLSAYAYNQAVVKSSAQATYTFSNTPVSSKTAAPAAPTSGALTQGSTEGTTMLTGVDSTMEYKVNEGDYSAISGSDVDNISVNAGDIIHVRYAATVSLPASETQNLTVALTDIKPAAAPTSGALSEGSYNGGTTKLTGVDSTMEYKLNDGYYSAIGGTEVDDIAVNAGDSIYVRYQETASQPASEAQEIFVQLWDIKPAAAPSASLTQGTNGSTTKLINVDDSMEYSAYSTYYGLFSILGTFSPISGTEVDNIYVNAGDIIYVRYKETSTQPASEEQEITVVLDDIRPADAPTASLTQGTEIGTTKLTNVDSTMEFNVNDGGYSTISGIEVDNISVNAGDKIYVRIAGTTSQPPSEAQEITVDSGNINTPSE
jgi:plastocyanin